MGWRPRDYLLAHHDLVMVGYRGVDGSSVLDCPEVKRALKGDGDLLGERSLRNIGAAWTRCASRLREDGVDLDGYTIVEVVDDLEAARVALGYGRVNLLGLSYGTRVAYLVALRHPSSILRSAMIGVNPPGHMVWEAATVDSQLGRWADLWARDAKMSARTPDLLATMRDVVHDMPKRWFPVTIDPGKVRVMTFLLLYHRKTAPLVFDAYVAAKRGDASGLALMSLAYDRMVPSLLTWGEMASKAVSADYDSSRDYVAELDPPQATMGSPLGKLLWGPLRFGSWPTRRIPEEYRRPGPSDVETLLISGSIDCATPAAFAEQELLPRLSHGRHVVLSEMGHVEDTWGSRREGVALLLTSFYQTGIANDSLIAPLPMDFSVKRGFPKLAKAGRAVLVVGVVVVAGGVGWLVRSLAR
ncbi:MAG: alpha/beta hydrolase [Candidatus Eisenbacteria bacterium]|nr:alpha/beta hydrolase [Candidatus Eisenbacteria bacterium]